MPFTTRTFILSFAFSLGWTAALSVQAQVVAQCGPANGAAFSSVPTTGFCNVGTHSQIYGTGPWTWTCAANTVARCSATLATGGIPFEGTGGGQTSGVNQFLSAGCGAANGANFTIAPTANLCYSGAASAVEGSGPWSWYCGTSTCAAFPSAPPPRAWDFWNTIGVNIHSGSESSSSVITQLRYLGIARVRDGSENNTDSYLEAVCAGTGVHYDLLSNAGVYYSSHSAQSVANDDLSTIQAVNGVAPGCIDEVEGINEPDIDTNLGSSLAAREAVGDQVSQAVWNTVKPAYPNMPLAVWAGGGDWDYTNEEENRASLTAYGDYCNVHDYYVSGQAGTSGDTDYGGDNPGSLARFASCQSDIVTDKQAVATEFGDYINPAMGSVWVDQDVQAKKALNKILDHALLGMKGSYIYELETPWLDNDYGIYDINGNPRELANVLHNLTTLIKDTGAGARTFTPATFNYRISNLPALGFSLLTQKSDGSYWLMIWNEVDLWNYNTETEITTEPVTVTVNFPRSASGSTYDPFVGTGPTSTFSNTAQQSVALTDHVVIVEINAAAQ